MSANVISGEAAESDLSEEDEPIQSVNNVIKKTIIPDAAVITGEASESDDEVSPSIVSTAGVHFSKSDAVSLPRSYDSLLHKKLIECNSSLYENITKVLKNTVQNSLGQLSSVDRQLLKSQLRLQQANASLKTLVSSSSLLAQKLTIATYGAYIPQITIPLPDSD